MTLPDRNAVMELLNRSGSRPLSGAETELIELYLECRDVDLLRDCVDDESGAHAPEWLRDSSSEGTNPYAHLIRRVKAILQNHS